MDGDAAANILCPELCSGYQADREIEKMQLRELA